MYQKIWKIFVVVWFLYANRLYPMHQVDTQDAVLRDIFREERLNKRYLQSVAGTLSRAAFDDAVDAVEPLIDRGASLDERGCNGMTPLQEAICLNHANTALELIDLTDNPASINTVSVEGFTALHYACERGQIVVVQNLIRRHASLDLPIKEGHGNITALHIAASLGNKELIEVLLAAGAKADVKDSMDRTPLHYIAIYGNDAPCYHNIAEKLLSQAPHTLDQVDTRGATPLMLAILNNKIKNLAFVTFLIQQGSDVNKKSYRLAEDVYNVTPLILAVYAHKCDVVTLLLEQGVDINATTAQGRTALDFAVNNKFEDIQRIFVLCKAHCTLDKAFLRECKANCVLYPLHVAAEAGNSQLLKQYLAEKYRTRVFDHLHCTPLHYACMSGDLESVKLLNGSRIDAVDLSGKTPLQTAIEAGHYKIVANMVRQYPSLVQGMNGARHLEIAAKSRHSDEAMHENMVLLFLQSGAQIDSPLFWAIRHKMPSVVRYLCAHPTSGQLLSLRDAHQKTPLHQAFEGDDDGVADILVKAGASLALQDAHGRTPLDYCAGKQKLLERIALLTDVNAIAASHAEESSLDLQGGGSSLSLQDSRIANLGLCGTIEHSLSQVREQAISNAYCAYYALFNARGAFAPPQLLCRAQFTEFFKQALQTIKNNGGKPPYDNLTTEQLRLMIKNHCSTLPIAVVEMNSLNSYLKNNLKLESALELKEGDRDLEVIQDFLEKRTDKIAVICGAGLLAGHWITIIAQRNADDTVALKIYDSLKSVKVWGQDLTGEILQSGILHIYLMLTSPLVEWKTVMNDVLLREIAEANVAEQIYPDEPTALLHVFENFIESLQALNMSVEKINSFIDQQRQVPNIERICLQIRLHVYTKVTKQLCNHLHKKRTQTKLADKASRKILKFYKLIYADVLQAFNQKMSSVLQLDGAERIELQHGIEKMAKKAIALKNLLATKGYSLTSGKFYDSNPLDIPADKLALIEKYLQTNVKELIFRINNGGEGVRTILFYGPPGNGKTTLAQAIAQLCPYKNTKGEKVAREFRIMRVPAMGTKYQFSKTEQLNTLSTFMKANPYAVILLDEVDALADSKEDQDTSVQVVQQILDAAKGTSVIFIGTTNNDIESMDYEGKNKRFPEAFISRIENKILIDNPQLEHRAAIIASLRAAIRMQTGAFVELSLTDAQELARKTQGFSIRDLETLFALAYQSTFTHAATEVPAKGCRITKEHFVKACAMIHKGKPNPHWDTITKYMKDFAVHGPAWLGLVQSGFATYLQEKHHREATQKAKQQQDWQFGGAVVNLLSTLVVAVCPAAAPFVAIGAAVYNVVSNFAQ